MNNSHFDFAEARQNMVENQLRPAEVHHTQLTEIMRALPREECVLPSQREIAYADINIPLSNGRFLSEPRVTARLLQLADIKPSEKVLIIGASTGYLAVIASLLQAKVFAVEEDTTLSYQGENFCNKYAKNVTWHTGKLVNGLINTAPYDLIIIDGTVITVPKSLEDQISDTGRIITVMNKEDETRKAVKIEKTKDGFSTISCFYAGLPLLREFNN